MPMLSTLNEARDYNTFLKTKCEKEGKELREISVNKYWTVEAVETQTTVHSRKICDLAQWAL